jgi:hypothetical protein
MQTQVGFCRKTDGRGYQVVDSDGQVLAQFGVGAGEKQRALRYQLQLENPEILRVSDRLLAKYPELRARLLRAAQLCASGNVQLNGSPGHYYVSSQSGNDVVYDVDTALSSCTCPDWEQGLLGISRAAPWCGTGPKCKHLLASYIAQTLGL